MLDRLARFFTGAPATPDRPAPRRDQDVAVASCALFLEMGGIDDAFTDDELAHLVDRLVDEHDLSRDDADALIEDARRELDDAVDLWQFTNAINKAWSTEDKVRVVEQLWELVYVDGTMDDHERYLITKLSNTLRLTRKQLMDAKQRVLDRH